MSNLINLEGRTFGRLTVLGVFERTKWGHKWLCECSCGNHRYVLASNLLSNKQKSCGCIMIEFISKLGLKHGHVKNKRATPEYKAWQHIKSRCYNLKDKSYADYGGRGIIMCDEWIDDFSKFLEDMGERPSKIHSVDRIKNEGNYEKNNCKWSTRKEQNKNKRNNIWIEYKGELIVQPDFMIKMNLTEGIMRNKRKRMPMIGYKTYRYCDD